MQFFMAVDFVFPWCWTVTWAELSVTLGWQELSDVCALAAGSQPWSSQVAKPRAPVPSTMSLVRRIWKNFFCPTPHGTSGLQCVAPTTVELNSFQRISWELCLAWNAYGCIMLVINKLKICKKIGTCLPSSVLVYFLDIYPIFLNFPVLIYAWFCLLICMRVE